MKEQTLPSSIERNPKSAVHIHALITYSLRLKINVVLKNSRWQHAMVCAGAPLGTAIRRAAVL
jgi:hypothetical protein